MAAETQETNLTAEWRMITCLGRRLETIAGSLPIPALERHSIVARETP